MPTNVTTNLDRLNELLQKEKLGIPEFRRRVSPSGNNLQWLRKILLQSVAASDEIRELISLDMSSLSRPRENAVAAQ